uniref:SGNH hydrolase-type esterase domain-containing protein n=1 Tax=Hucho hucho TaxID=62062 RepID=A0A4W5QIX2_9TELE
YNVYISDITHIKCIHCTLNHLLNLAYAVRPSTQISTPGGAMVGLRTPARNGQQPSTIITGSFMVRSVEKLGYWIYQKMPTIKKQIPALKIVMLHIGFNDIMRVKSVKLRDSFLQLLENSQKLAEHVIVSGPIPSPCCCGIECFSRLWSLHQWLMRLTKDLGMSFVDNFHSFWNRPGYFVEDGIHLGENGSRLTL